jgi:hypothetical protein
MSEYPTRRLYQLFSKLLRLGAVEVNPYRLHHSLHPFVPDRVITGLMRFLGNAIIILWTPVAVNEKPLLRGKKVLPEHSAAVIGNSVALRFFGRGLTGPSIALTTIPFPTAEEASGWVEENRMTFEYASELP